MEDFDILQDQMDRLIDAWSVTYESLKGQHPDREEIKAYMEANLSWR